MSAQVTLPDGSTREVACALVVAGKCGGRWVVLGGFPAHQEARALAEAEALMRGGGYDDAAVLRTEVP